jgi:hypothetical protein
MKRRAFPALAAAAVGAAVLAPCGLGVRPANDSTGAEVTAVAAQGAPAVRPDDRAGVLGVGAVEPAVSPAAAHPDNRAVPKGAFPSVVSETGTDWTTIGIGVAAGIAALLVVGVVVARTGRGGWHMPHRPAHTH